MSFLGFGGSITKGLQHKVKKSKQAADERVATRKRKEEKEKKAETRRRKSLERVNRKIRLRYGQHGKPKRRKVKSHTSKQGIMHGFGW